MSDMITPVSAKFAIPPAPAGRRVSGDAGASGSPIPPQAMPQPPPPAVAAAVSRDDLTEVVGKMQRQAEAAGAELQFSVDDELDRVVVTVRDSRDGSVLRQIPSEEALQLARVLAEQAAPLLNAVA